jgi:hypothetical protein
LPQLIPPLLSPNISLLCQRSFTSIVSVMLCGSCLSRLFYFHFSLMIRALTAPTPLISLWKYFLKF